MDRQGEAAEALQRHFALTLNSGSPVDFPYTAADLIRESSLIAILDRQAAALGHPEPHVTGTLFAKRYSVWARGALASFSLYDYPLDLDHGRVRFRLAERGMMHYAAEAAIIVPCGTSGQDDRSTSASQYMGKLREHLAPIMRAVSTCTGANEKVMWSLVAHNAHSLYGGLEADSGLPMGRDRRSVVQHDWRMLSSAEPFGAARFSKFEDERLQGPPLYLRRHCCLAHKLDRIGDSVHGYCGSCPKLTSEERWKLLYAK